MVKYIVEAEWRAEMAKVSLHREVDCHRARCLPAISPESIGMKFGAMKTNTLCFLFNS